MFNSNNANMKSKFFDRMFRRIHGLVWDLTSGKIGIQDTNGIYTLDVSGEGDAVQYRPSVNPFDNFGTAIPAFAQQVAHEKIKVGDIIVGDKGILGWVIGKKEVALVLMDKNGMTKNYTPPKVAIMGGDGAMVVQNLFNLAGGADGLTGLQGNLLPIMMMMGDNESALEKILPIMLFSQSTGTGAGAINPMMLLAMSGGLGKGSKIDPMMLAMMGGFGGGNAGMNPMVMLAMSGGLESLGASSDAVVPANANAVGGTPVLRPLNRR